MGKAIEQIGAVMSTDRVKCMFMVMENPGEQRSVAVVLRDELPALSGRTLSFDLDPDATPEQAETFAGRLPGSASCG